MIALAGIQAALLCSTNEISYIECLLPHYFTLISFYETHTLKKNDNTLKIDTEMFSNQQNKSGTHIQINIFRNFYQIYWQFILYSLPHLITLDGNQIASGTA